MYYTRKHILSLKTKYIRDKIYSLKNMLMPKVRKSGHLSMFTKL